MSKAKKTKPHKARIRNKNSWAGIVTVFFLSVLVMLSSLDNLPGVTGHAIKNNYRIASAQAGSALLFEARVGGINTATIHTTDLIKGVNLLFEVDDSIPFEGTVLSKVAITSDEKSKIGKIDLNLKIKEEEIKKSRLKIDEVKLYWKGEEKELIQTKMDRGFVFYSVTIDSPGNIVIGKSNALVVEKKEIKKIEPTKISEPAKIKETEPMKKEPVVPQEKMAPVFNEPMPQKVGLFESLKNFFRKFLG